MIQRPGRQFGGNVRRALEFQRTRTRKFDGAAHPIPAIGCLGQRLESITPVEQYPESSVALRYYVDGAQPQHLEPRDPPPVDAHLCGEILKLATMIDCKNGQVSASA